MKKICLILLVTSCFFSGSKAQDVPKRVLDWCSAVSDQNKELWQKVTVKDTTIVKLERLHNSDTTKLGSFARDLQATEKRGNAFREESVRKDTIIAVLKTDVKKANTRTWGVGGLGLLLTILAIAL